MGVFFGLGFCERNIFYTPLDYNKDLYYVFACKYRPVTELRKYLCTFFFSFFLISFDIFVSDELNFILVTKCISKISQYKVAQLKECCKGKWILCGDFNSTRGMEECRRKSWSSKASTLFNDLIMNLELINPPMINQSFTWSNMQKNPTLARLDRFLFSTEWDQKFPLTKVEALPRVTSNHCPILLYVERRMKKKKKIFHFEEAWLNHEGFISKLPDWRNEVDQKKSAVATFTPKLRHCRRRIKEWCSNEFYSINGLKNYLLGEIQVIDGAEEQGDLSTEMFMKREKLKAKLRDVLDDEAALWRTRANQHWLWEGDRNTKFFHCVANGRRRTNRIGTVVDDGVTYHSEEDKKRYFFHKFKELFNPKAMTPSSFGEWSGLFRSNRVSTTSQIKLIEPLKIDEIKLAVLQLGSDKALGHNGFPLRFYQKFWDVFKEDLLNLFQEMYEGRLSTDPIDLHLHLSYPQKGRGLKGE